jgi:tetratricopeptide (TPR) repeat protein
MSTDVTQPSSTTFVATKDKSSTVLGEDSSLAPKSELTLDADYSANDAISISPEEVEDAESRSQQLMADAAASAFQRAENFPNSQFGWSQAGFAALAARSLDRAGAAFARAIDIDPHYRRALLGAARVANETGDRQRSLRLLQTLLEEYPEDLDARVALAIVTAADDRTEEALSLLSGPVAEVRESANLLATRGSLLIALGRPQDAISDLRKAVRLQPDSVHVRNVLGLAEFRSGNLRAAERRFREAMRVGPFYDEATVNLMRLFLAEERFTEVLAVAKAHQTPYIGTTVARLAGEAAFRLSKWAEARTWLQRGLKTARDSTMRAVLLNDIGATYSREKNHEKSAKFYKQSVDEHVTEAALTNCAKAFIDLGDSAAAVAWLRQWQDHGSPGYDRLATYGLALTNVDHVEEALRVLEPLRHSPKANTQLFALLSAIYADRLLAYDRAVEMGIEGLRRFPHYPTLANNVAYALAMKGDTRRALEFLNQAEAPTSTQLTHITATRGLVALREGKLGEGRALYEEALAMASSEATRARVRAKRDLEVARALLRIGGSEEEASRLLARATREGAAAHPYPEQATDELKRLRAGSQEPLRE